MIGPSDQGGGRKAKGGGESLPPPALRPPPPYVGQSVRRREDPRLLTGRGLFVADVRLPGLVHAAFLRSPHAHARIVRVDLRRALAQPDVLAALSGAELGPEAPRLPMLVPHRALRPRM